MYKIFTEKKMSKINFDFSGVVDEKKPRLNDTNKLNNLPDEIDPILKKKIEFIKKGISKIDKNFIL